MSNKRFFLTGFLALTLMLFGAVASPVIAQGESDCGSTYEVQSGDYLSRIANECGVSYRALIGANPEIEDPNIIYPGQVINIPDPSDTGDEVSIPVTGGSTYIVQPGDTLSTIADRFQVTVDELLDANTGLSRSQPVQAGQQVRLPQGAARVPTISVTPTTTTPGALVTIALTGFRADMDVILGFGPVNSEYQEIARGTTNSNGALYRTLRVPDWADADGRYVFAVQREDAPEVNAISNPLTLASSGGGGGGGGGGTGIPVTGPDTYTVQSGETLSEIAVRYDISIEELLDLNPEIEDPALIFSGQRINLPDDVRPVNPWVGVSDRRVNPGQQLRVRAINFPANAIVDVRLAPVGGSWQTVLDARANAEGEVLVTIMVPEDAASGAEWQAIVTTTERAEISRATSRPFFINE